jgi:hypothetical protein
MRDGVRHSALVCHIRPVLILLALGLSLPCGSGGPCGTVGQAGN